MFNDFFHPTTPIRTDAGTNASRVVVALEQAARFASPEWVDNPRAAVWSARHLADAIGWASR